MDSARLASSTGQGGAPSGGNFGGFTVVLRRIGGILVIGTLITSTLFAFGTPASAARAEPSISSLAWWWEDARTEQREVPNVGTITIETPNPFCPSPGSGLGSPQQVCAEGRLPIEVHNGDYETQNKISGVGFDFTLVPVGSKINKFTVTFREAKEGCYDKDGKQDDDPNDDTCEETNPINVGEHQLQACVITAFFGDGEARQYKEAPKYECTSADPKASRKEVKSDKDGEGSDFYWTFDLTPFAERWVSKFTAVTGIMIVGAPIIEGKGEDAEQDSDSWRVVLTGPNFTNGVTTDLDYIPADDPILPPTDTGTGTGTDTGFTDTGSTTGFDTGTTGTTGTTGDIGGDTGSVDGSGAAPAPTQSPVLSVEEPQPVEELPGYIWLALIAGLVGFSLVRSIVIEKTTGIRPDGVLATIHALNADRAGAAAAEAGSKTGLAAGLGVVGSKIAHVFGKLNFRKKG